MDVSTFLERVRGATETPTLYFLGKGGWPNAQRGMPHPQPGELVLPRECLDDMQAHQVDKYHRYEQEAAQAGVSLAAVRQMPRSPACDCTRFVAWALDVPHDVRPDGTAGWFYTGSILDDVFGARKMFERFDVATPGMAALGTMLVYASDGEHEVGHIGVVSAVDDLGRPTRVIHCAPGNYLAPPLPGCEPNAIRETGLAPFFSLGGTSHVIVVRCKLLSP